MKHREHMEMVLNHRLPGHCPIQLSFLPEFEPRLKKKIGNDSASQGTGGVGAAEPPHQLPHSSAVGLIE